MAKGRAFDALRKAWLEQLAHERRASPHTLRAYGDDAARFGGFLTNHFGGTVSEIILAKLAPADIRAFITHRRAEGLGAGGVQRALAAIRSFYLFLAREGILENAAPQGVRSPRLPKRLPRPLFAGTPRPIIDRVLASLKSTLTDPTVRERLSGEGADPVGSSPEEYDKFTREEIEKWIKVARAAGIQPE